MGLRKCLIHPESLRIETSTICQLNCPLCRAREERKADFIGSGLLTFDHFKKIIDKNKYIRRVELSNWGEPFLNKDLPEILKYSYKNDVITEIDEGANLNDASVDALEALVEHKTRKLRCAIDGVTNRTYQTYRRGGNLKKVIDNIHTINSFKKKYDSEYPKLILQFIVFGHNENEMEKAVMLAEMLKMKISFKLNVLKEYSPTQDTENVKKFIRHCSRQDYYCDKGKHYMRHQCRHLWNSPQINWDGRLLGCARNIWGVYADNVFQGELIGYLNNEKICYARRMLMGKAPPKEDVPCVHCDVYESIREAEDWITEEEIVDYH